MFEEEFIKLPTADQREFSRVVNVLLIKGFIVRDVFDPREKMMRTNTDYRFIERYFPIIEDYLKYSGWHIEKDVASGVVCLTNENEENRLRLDRETSLLLFVLRLVYEDERKEGAQTNDAIYLTTPGLIKAMFDHGITMPGKKLSGRQISKSLRFLANHNVISKVSGSYDEGNVSFYVLPSIVYALDNNKIVAMSEAIDQINNAGIEGKPLDATSVEENDDKGEGNYENNNENKID
jgi:hypothetical protein